MSPLPELTNRKLQVRTYRIIRPVDKRRGFKHGPGGLDPGVSSELCSGSVWDELHSSMMGNILKLRCFRLSWFKPSLLISKGGGWSELLVFMVVFSINLVLVWTYMQVFPLVYSFL